MTELAPALIDWLPHQRWFGGKGRPISAVRWQPAPPLATGQLELHLLLVEVHYADGGKETYQVPLSMRREAWDDIAPALVAEHDGCWWYDAPHDPDAATLLLDSLRAQSAVGTLSFHRLGEIPPALHPRLVGAEQSNTSIVYGEEVILKLFRRVASGLNPDLELTRALAEAGSAHVAPVLGWLAGEPGGELHTLAIAQRFVASATDGWRLALASVRDLYAEADLHADEVGGDFAGESHRLGEATASVHVLLAQHLATATAGAGELRATAQAMRDRLAAASAAVPQLSEHAAALQTAFDGVSELSAVPVQRIHGDYHLGQVLRTDSGWLLLDFEGEPARPLAERTALGSPLRDVAGMLRSYDYAARALLAEQPGGPGLEYRAGEWAERNRAAFCDGYAAVSGRDPREEHVLLTAFELDKAVYEVMYEARNRPGWLRIPLGSIARIVAAAERG